MYLNAVAYARSLQSQRQNRTAPTEREQSDVSSQEPPSSLYPVLSACRVERMRH